MTSVTVSLGSGGSPAVPVAFTKQLTDVGLSKRAMTITIPAIGLPASGTGRVCLEAVGEGCNSYKKMCNAFAAAPAGLGAGIQAGEGCAYAFEAGSRAAACCAVGLTPAE